MEETVHQVSEHIGPGSVSVARVGTRLYQGMNETGDTVLIGPDGEPGHFSPGQLLKLALAACAGMSSDKVISRRLGDDYDTTIWAHGTSDKEQNRYTDIAEEMLLDTSSLSADERTTLLAVIHKSIAAACTIERTIGDVVTVHHTMDGTAV